ncbi:MAG: PDZ domain-containing protein [Planctomycetaceae bacterium]|nr:PDZ domain-containing protein [Planctomycetaceae bacterium]
MNSLNISCARLGLALLLTLASSTLRIEAQESPSLTELEEQAFKQAVAFAEPSIVRIQTVGGLDRVGQILTSTGPTSGLVVSEDGYIISSAFNFISKPASVLVELADGRRFPAIEVATDRSRMLTLLKIEAENLKPAIPVPKDELAVGQWAIAAGRTYSAQVPNVSIGIVSALNRIWGKAIQTDAKVSPVNYGGPLLNIEGKVMGVLVPLSASATTETAGVEWYDSGIGFAIPLEDVYAILDRLKEGEDLHPGLMGVTFRRNDLTEGELEIDMVRPDSPAYRAGMRRGDILLSVDEMPLSRVGHLRYALGTHYAGETIPATFRKGEEVIETTMTLVETLIPYESGFLGILPTREPIDAPRTGVTVRYVYTESAADQAGLKKDDRIVEFQGEPVKEYADLWTLISRERPENEVSVTFERGNLKETVKLTLTTTTEEIPVELLDEFIPPPEEGDVDKDLPTGFVTVPMEAHNHEYWAYIPNDYNPSYQYGLVVWIHPGGDTMEASIAQDWQQLCERRGLIMIGPKAAKIGAWNLNEAEFIKDAVLDIKSRYRIDDRRIAIHGYGSGGAFAAHLAFKYRDTFRAAAIAGAPIPSRPPENDPEYRLQLLFSCGDEDPEFEKVDASVKILKRLKFPVVFQVLKGRGHTYPTPARLEEISIWLDSLDRL